MAGIFSFLKPSGKKAPLFGKRKFDVQIAKKYDLLEELGTGGFSEVRVGKEIATGRRYAVKCIAKKSLAKTREGFANVENEVSILGRIKHKNVIALVDLIDNRKALYLVMELVSGGELFDRIIARGSYTELDACEITKQILEAMTYIHSLGIVHRDLKPENLLYESPAENANIMVTDFGLAKHVKDLDEHAIACGTPGYVAPEVLCLQPYGVAVDCWGIGVITYILLCGYPPFYDDQQRNDVLNQQIVRGDYEFDSPYWDDVSYEAKDFISKLMQVDPNKRSSCEQALQHTWIRGEHTYLKDIYLNVAERMQKHRARSNWKKVIIATKFIERMRRLTLIDKGSEDEEDEDVEDDNEDDESVSDTNTQDDESTDDLDQESIEASL